VVVLGDRRGGWSARVPPWVVLVESVLVDNVPVENGRPAHPGQVVAQRP
jgi:hypothetical protein